MSDAELKTCPFCGGGGAAQERHRHNHDGKSLTLLGCWACEIEPSISGFTSKRSLIVLAWNTRAPDAYNEGEAAALVALVRHGARTDIQELLIYGSKTAQVPPGALRQAINAVLRARVQGGAK